MDQQATKNHKCLRLHLLWVLSQFGVIVEVFRDVTFWMMLCPICHVLMGDILIHLKGCAKTVPLHTTLPANPRYWLGADSKATPLGLCTPQSQVNLSRGQWQEMHLKRWMLLIPLHMYLWFIFCFLLELHSFVVNHIKSLVYSSGHCPSVFLFHMDIRVERAVGWMGLMSAIMSYMYDSLRWFSLRRPLV